MKIDIYSHILPLKYKESLYKIASSPRLKETIEAVPTLFDIEMRLKILDRYECAQVLTLGLPPIETVADPKRALELSRIANDEIAELLIKYPNYFVAGVATLPMNDVDAALSETDRCISELKFRGVQIYSSINGKPLDSSEFLPL